MDHFHRQLSHTFPLVSFVWSGLSLWPVESMPTSIPSVSCARITLLLSGLTALSQVWPCPCLCTPSPCVIRKALQIQHSTLLTSLFSRGYKTLFAQILLLSDTWDLVHKEASKSQGEVNQGERVCPSSLRARKKGLTCASLAWF